MKKSLVILMLALVSVVSCGKKDDRVPITAGAGRDARANPDPASPAGPGGTASKEIQLAGQVRGGDQDTFQDNVHALLDATIASEYIGFVSAQGANNTGVFFGGDVRFENGCPPTGSTTRFNITANSRLLLVVFDEFVGKKDENGNVFPSMPIHLKTATGYVQGSQAYMTFSDSYGKITLEGQLNGTYFDGNLSFDNNVSQDGGAGWRGVLGQFRVPIDQFFTCN